MFFLLLLAAQAAIFTIYGHVRLPDGSPASRVTVTIASQEGLNRQVFSDDMGRYEIRDLPRGRYFLRASNPAAPDQFTDPVEADTARSYGGRILVHIFLRKRPTPESSEEHRQAVISVAEAAQRIPKDAQKAFDRGLKYRSENKPERALESFSRAVDLYPGYFQAFAERGHLRIGLGQTPQAATDFAEALKLDARHEPALRGSGMCKFQQGKFAEAAAELEAAVAIDPSRAKSHLFLGLSDLALDRHDAARAALEQALSLDPTGSVRARVYLANLYLKENQLEKAAAELRAYLAAVPDAPDAAKLRALEEQLRDKIKK